MATDHFLRPRPNAFGEVWRLFSGYWQVRWVTAVFVATHMCQVVFQLQTGIEGERAFSLSTMAGGLIGLLVYLISLGWLGSVFLPGANRMNWSRWRPWLLIALTYAASAIVLSLVGGFIKGLIVIPAFAEGGISTVVATHLLASLPPALILMPVVVRLLLQAGGHNQPHLVKLASALWGSERPYLFCYAFVLVVIPTSGQILLDSSGPVTNGVVLQLAVIDAIAIAIAVLLAVSAAARIVYATGEAEEVFG